MESTKACRFFECLSNSLPLDQQGPGRTPRAPHSRLGQKISTMDSHVGNSRSLNKNSESSPVAAFLCSVSLNWIPERHPPLAFELGQLNLLDPRVVLRAGVDRQLRREHGWNEFPYVCRLSHLRLAFAASDGHSITAHCA